jgi:hypothetical protein
MPPSVLKGQMSTRDVRRERHGGVDRHVDDAVDLPVEHGRQRPLLGCRLVTGCGDDELEAGIAEHGLQDRGARGVELVGDVGQEEADHPVRRSRSARAAAFGR